MRPSVALGFTVILAGCGSHPSDDEIIERFRAHRKSSSNWPIKR
jgi:hypothetical protein